MQNKSKIKSQKLKAALILNFVFLIFNFSTLAQDNEAQLKKLSDKCADYHNRTNGESNGYRIKIHFGVDKATAMEVKQKFTEKYSGISAYDEYQQPNFVIVIGDFKTRIDAYKIFKEIQVDFPNAFIIKDKIKSIKK